LPELINCDPVARRLVEGTINLGYREWGWGEGVALYGLIRAAQLLRSDRCVREVREFLRANEQFQPDRAEHIMPALASILFYEQTGEEVGLTLASRVVDMLRTYPRSRHGAFIATPVRTTWVDYFYETVPFLCHYSRIVGSAECQHWAVEQTLAYLMACWNAHDGLFAHVYYDDVGTVSPFYWARANGWAALGLVEAALLFPAEWRLKTTLLRTFSELAEAVSACQRPSGLWTTVLHDTRTYEETSASAMISLALHQGVRLGWLDRKFQESADRAWGAVIGHIDPEGRLHGVSAETPPGDADYYQAIPVGVFPWGQGFSLLAALEREFAGQFDDARPSASGGAA